MPPEAASWGIDFKLVIDRQKTPKEPMAHPHFLPKRVREKNLLREGNLRMRP